MPKESNAEGKTAGSDQANLFIFNQLSAIFPPISALEVHFWGQK